MWHQARGIRMGNYMKFYQSRFSARSNTRRRGSTLLEFAIIALFVLIPLLLGIIEFGWFARNKLQLANAVREGARSAAIGKTPDQIKQLIANRCAGIPGASTNINDNKPLVTINRDDNNEGNGYDYTTAVSTTTINGTTVNDAPSGCLIQVTGSMAYQSLTGMPFTTGKTLSVSVAMRREQT